MASSPKKGSFRYELEKYSRQYVSNSSNKSPPQWTHISQPSIVILENMFPTGVTGGAGVPMLRVVSDQNVLLESLNVSYRYADSLKAKALLRSPTIGIRYNYAVLSSNNTLSSQETRKIQLRFKNIDDFESCASIIERYISCKRMDGSTLNLNSELGINGQAQESTYNNMDLSRTQREPSIAYVTREGNQQQRISSRNQRLQISNKQSSEDLRSSSSTSSGQLTNEHQCAQVPKSNLQNEQLVTGELLSSNDKHSQEPIIYTNSRNTNVNRTTQKTIVMQNELDEPSLPSDRYISPQIPLVQSREQSSLPPRHMQKQNQNQRQYQPRQYHLMNDNESRDLQSAQKHETTTNNTIMRSSNTSNINMTSNQFQSNQIQQHQSVFPNNQNVTSYSYVLPQTSQKNITRNVPNSCAPCNPNQITFNSMPVQQVKIKQEKMEIPPTPYIKKPYFIDLTMDDDDSFEFDFQPTHASVSHTQAQAGKLIKQFTRPIVSQPMNQPMEAPTPLSQSAQSIVMQITPQNTHGEPNFRNRLLSTTQPSNHNSTHLSESSIQRQNISLPEDDAVLQDWIVNILKDPNFPQFVSRVEKLWKVHLLACDL